MITSETVISVAVTKKVIDRRILIDNDEYFRLSNKIFDGSTRRKSKKRGERIDAYLSLLSQ